MLALACVALLAGCGGGSNSGGTSDGGGGAAATDTPDTAEATLSQEAIDYWNGGWYGWWTYTNATGEAEGGNGGSWDCLAEFTTGADGKGSLVLWDEDWAKDDGVAELSYTITPAGGSKGTLTNDSGWMVFHEDVISAGTWVLDSSAMGADNYLVITGHYNSTARPGDSFDYTIHLRPWGTTWDDAPAEKPEYYDDWYLPLIESGASMPDTIG
jgi:hypothetical protein